MVARVGIEKCRIGRDFAWNASAAGGSYPESYPAIFSALVTSTLAAANSPRVGTPDLAAAPSNFRDKGGGMLRTTVQIVLEVHSERALRPA